MPDFTEQQLKKQRKLQTLRETLANHSGIYAITQAQIDEAQIEVQLAEEAARSNTSFNISNWNIGVLKTAIEYFKEHQLANNQTASHVGVFYGLDSSEAGHQINLVVKGVKLDDSPDADLSKKINPAHYCDSEFSSKDTMLREDAETKETHKNIRDNYIEFFRPAFKNKKILQGGYLRLGELFNTLTTFEQEGCDELRITFGLNKAKFIWDWNCFHLIFRGVNSLTDQLSTNIFSTFNHIEKGFSGFKPSTPPFGN